MKYILPASLLLYGCKVGPDYHQPEVVMPMAFEELHGEGEAAEDLSQWWKQFQDPLLDDLIAEALATNYDLRIAIEKIEQTRAQYRIEKAHLWPEIDINAVGARSEISQNTVPSSTSSAPGTPSISKFIPKFLDTFQVGFDAIWELDFFGKFRRSKNAAYFSWEAMKEDARSVLISMLSEVAVSYLNIRAIQNKIDLAKKKIIADEEELAITTSRFQIGLDNEIQLTSLISTLEADRSAVPVLETSLKQTVYGLAYLLGKQPEGMMELFQEIRPIPSSTDKIPVGLPADLLRRRPDVRSAERQLASASEEVGVAVADYFPHIVLTGINLSAGNQLGSSVGYESSSLNKLFKSASRVFSVGVGINWDMLDFGRVRGKVEVQKSLHRQALLNYEQTVIGSLKDVESALVAYFEEEKRRDLLSNKVEADRRTFEITKDLFQVGIANETQVLNAKKIMIDAESALVESDQSLAGDLVAVYKAIGGNWDAPN